jgi:hypothetical protein
MALCSLRDVLKIIATITENFIHNLVQIWASCGCSPHCQHGGKSYYQLHHVEILNVVYLYRKYQHGTNATALENLLKNNMQA